MNSKEFVKSLFERARAAQKEIEHYTQEQVDDLIRAITWNVTRDEFAIQTAKFAIEETKLGNFEGKLNKLQKKTRGVLWETLQGKSVGIIEDDKEKGIIKIAKPVGVIGAITPRTNPCVTPVLKAIWTIKGRNAMVCGPHPHAKKTAKIIFDNMRKTLKEYGAPEDLLICVEEPTLEISKEIMSQCDLVVATGGQALVRAAYSSGKPAYGVGVGNAVSIIDETANLKDAANKIHMSQINDLATGCSTENSIIVQESIYDEFMDAMKNEKGYVVNEAEKSKLKNGMWHDGKLNIDIVAQTAERIAKVAGIDVPESTDFILVPEEGIGAEYPFSGEKLSVVLTVFKYKDFIKAVEMVNDIHKYAGAGHSCGIHSFNEEHIKYLALNTKTSRVMIRQPQNYGNAGFWGNHMPWTTTLGCGTWGGNITNENVTWKHFINTTWLAYPKERYVPTDEELFGDLIKRQSTIV